MPGKKIINYRSAISGRFVKSGTARRHPKTTIKETRKLRGK